MKPYWAMNQIEYAHLFLDTRLFIIFGCSLGDSDGWWWRRIHHSLKLRPDEGTPLSELIIYWWVSDTSHACREDVLARFFAGAGDPPEAERAEVQAQIQVVVYDDATPRAFLSTPLQHCSRPTPMASCFPSVQPSA